MKRIYTYRLFALVFAFSFFLMSCDEEEMVVDRVQSPVLVTVAGSSFAASESVNVTATVYELDKSGILNHSVGIDSIPVANLSIQVIANGKVLGNLTTDAAGKAQLTKTWAELGFASPARGNSASLEWSGSYKGQAFTKLSQVQVR